MTTRYRVEYALKTHRRDQFIEWIKGLLATPFVLLAQPTVTSSDGGDKHVSAMAEASRRRYAEIMLDVETLVNDHIRHQTAGTADRSKLKLLVPSIGNFFTPISLRDAFIFQDDRRFISSRRFVAPSFNDVRLVLNTAQVIGLQRTGPLRLLTMDGDVTLYDDGCSLASTNPVIPRILDLMKQGVKIGVVTAAGYSTADRYYERLQGLLDTVQSCSLDPELKCNLIVMGGESNFLFQFDPGSEYMLSWVNKKDWVIEEMGDWTEDAITDLLDVAEEALKDCLKTMHLDGHILRKERAVGIIPKQGRKLAREQLEETVLVTQRTLETSPAGRRLPFCVFNGGNDVFVDIGDKAWGVLACQRFFGGVEGGQTLHVGDQFLSVGANDFKARGVCATAWVASPEETVGLLDEIREMTGRAI